MTNNHGVCQRPSTRKSLNPNAPEFVPQWPNTTPVERKVMAIEHVKAAVEHVNIAIGTKPPCAEDPWSTFNGFACLLLVLSRGSAGPRPCFDMCCMQDLHGRNIAAPAGSTAHLQLPFGAPTTKPHSHFTRLATSCHVVANASWHLLQQRSCRGCKDTTRRVEIYMGFYRSSMACRCEMVTAWSSRSNHRLQLSLV